MTATRQHPVVRKLGIQTTLYPNSNLVFSAAPGVDSQWQHAKVRLFEDNALEFLVSDDSRSFSAKFSPEGKLTAINCSDGIPSGETEMVLEMFFEEARIAFQSLVLVH